MGHNRVRAKVRRRKVAALASYSRQFTVKNNTIPNVGLNKKNVVTIWHEIRTSRFDTPVYGKTFEIDKDGHYHLVERKFDPTPMLIDHKQPKNLRKKKSYWRTTKDSKTYISHKSEYPDYTPYKMTRVEYCEKLVEHKLKKWERKNPAPADMFTEDVEKWKQLRETAKERFRDFVVSIYDPLWIMGNRIDIENAKMKASKIAEVKDIDGKGHNVHHPNLSTEDKLYKDANKKAQEVMNKDASIVDADLMNHKRNQKRPLTAKRAKTATLADKRIKKAA